MLLGIRVRNFEMLRDTRVGVLGEEVFDGGDDPEHALAAGLVPAIPLESLTALIGRNDTGKSSLFHAMHFLSDTVRHGARYASTLHGRKGFTHLRSNGGPDPVVFDLAVRLPDPEETVLYHVVFDCDRFGRPHVSEEELLRADFASRTTVPLMRLDGGHGRVDDGGEIPDAGVGNADATGLGTFGALVNHPLLHALHNMLTRWFFCDFLPADGEPAAVSSPSSGGHRHIAPDGSNVENVLLYHREADPKAFEQILSRIRERMPGRRP
jgi:predicted ATPase